MMSYVDVVIHDAESGNHFSGSFFQVDECPLCGFGIKPTILYSYYVNKNQAELDRRLEHSLRVMKVLDAARRGSRS